MNKLKTLLATFAAALIGFVYVSGPIRNVEPIPQKKSVDQAPIPQPPSPQVPQVTTQVPSYLAYPALVEQLKKWASEAPDFAEVGSHGKASSGQDIYYIRVTNKMSTAPKKKVLITGCIHGNEPLACSTVMGFIGTMLGNYGKDQEVTALLDTRDIYFVPVISPDSYPNARYVDGVDPNRNYPGLTNPNHQSVPPVKAIQNLFLREKFDAAISGHTFGRVFLTPYGDSENRCPNEADYQRIVVQKMCSMTGYRWQHCCENYGHPIFGTEVDWYYRNGCFSMVCEFGTHQRIPSDQDIQSEFNKTYRAVLYFVREGALVKVPAFR